MALAFQITAGHVVEKEIRFLPRPLGRQPLLNRLLVLAQPGEVGVEIVLVETAPDADHVAGCMALGPAHGGPTRALLDHASQHLPQRQLAGKLRAERLVDPEAPGDFKDGPQGTRRALGITAHLLISSSNLTIGENRMSQRCICGVDSKGFNKEGCRNCNCQLFPAGVDRKSTRLNSSHITISYAVFCLKKKIKNEK